MIKYFLQGASYVGREGVRQADLSAVSALGPILALVLVIVLVFAILKSTEILGDSPWIAIIIALVIGFAFVSVGNVVNLVLEIIPWFGVYFIVLFMLMLFAGLLGKMDVIGKGFVWGGACFMVIVFVLSMINVFGAGFTGYLPGPYFGAGGEPELLYFFDWLYSPHIYGGILLIVVSIAISWILMKIK